MRYDEQLEHAARALAAMPRSQAASVAATRGVRAEDRERFRRSARGIARRLGLYVVIDEGDGLATASFFRDDRDAPV